MFGFRMAGSGLSSIQRSKAQEGRYGKGEREGGGVLKKKQTNKHLSSFSGGYELSRDKTSYYSPRYQHSRPQRLSVLIDQKKRWALRMMVKRTCAHAQ